jgi:hypothetical protein
MKPNRKKENKFLTKKGGRKGKRRKRKENKIVCKFT